MPGHDSFEGQRYLPYPSLAMGNAGVDPRDDGRFDDLVVSSYLLR